MSNINKNSFHDKYANFLNFVLLYYFTQKGQNKCSKHKKMVKIFVFFLSEDTYVMFMHFCNINYMSDRPVVKVAKNGKHQQLSWPLGESVIWLRRI